MFLLFLVAAMRLGADAAQRLPGGDGCRRGIAHASACRPACNRFLPLRKKWSVLYKRPLKFAWCDRDLIDFHVREIRIDGSDKVDRVR